MMVWLKLFLGGIAIVITIFGAWEGIEKLWFPHADPRTMHYLYIARGSLSSILLMAYATFFILRYRRRYEENLERSKKEIEASFNKSMKDLDESQKFTELLLNSISDKIIVVDKNFRIIKANKAAIDHFGPDIIGKMCYSAYEKKTVPCDHCPIPHALDTAAPSSYTKIEPNPLTGEILLINTYPVPDDDGNIQAFVTVAKDITEQKKLESQLLHHEKMAAFGILAAGIAHDIGNPLSSISTEIQLLESGEEGMNMKESLRVLRTNIERISRVLRDLVTFARINKEMKSEKDISLNSVIEDSLRLLKHDPRMKGVDLKVELDSNIPPLRAAEDHVFQVFLNLLNNALDAMPQGGMMKITTALREGGIAIEVKDSGIGMSDAVKKCVFEPFFTTKDNGRGAGLGLFTCNETIKNLGGQITVESAQGKGSSFNIFIPVPRVEEVTTQGKGTELTAQETKDIKSRK